MGYFQGAVEGVYFAQDVYSRTNGVSGKLLCLPKDVSMKEIAKKYIKVVGQDEELKTMSQAAALDIALGRAFPCN